MNKRTQQELLSHDVAEYRRLLEENPGVLNPLGDVTDPNKHAKYLTVAELVWRIWSHALAVDTLLKEELHTSVLAVMRAIFDAGITLDYLIQHQQFQDEAVVLLAYSFLRDMKQFPNDTKLVSQFSAIIARMPAHLVQTAKQRASNHPRTWSGKTVRQMAEAANVRGYDSGYAYLSAEIHGSAMGRHIKASQDGETMNIAAGFTMTPSQVESSANFTRRFLHATFKRFWNLFDGPKVTIRGEDPEAWKPEEESSV